MDTLGRFRAEQKLIKNGVLSLILRKLHGKASSDFAYKRDLQDGQEFSHSLDPNRPFQQMQLARSFVLYFLAMLSYLDFQYLVAGLPRLDNMVERVGTFIQYQIDPCSHC